MKKAENYLKGAVPFNENGGYGKAVVIQLIKDAQKDAIDAAVKMCAKEAKINVDDWLDNGEEYPFKLDKQSILKVANKLKKELE